jgi:hypothetical protein
MHIVCFFAFLASVKDPIIIDHIIKVVRALFGF